MSRDARSRPEGRDRRAGAGHMNTSDRNKLAFVTNARDAARHAPPTPAPIAGDRILRPREVFVRVGLSRTTLWRAVRRGAFPAPCRLTANTVDWRASEVDAWIATRTPTCAPASGAASQGDAP